MKPISPASIRLAAVLLTAVAGAWPAGATTYVSMTDEALLDRSPYVVEGRIMSVEVAPEGGLPAIDYLVHVEHLIKGPLGRGGKHGKGPLGGGQHGKGPLKESSLVVRVPGGVRPDGVGLKIWGAPRFSKGDEALLFLTPRGDGTFALHQLMLGAFHIEWVGARRVAVRQLGEAVELTEGGRATEDGARDLEAFRLWMTDRLRGVRREADYRVSQDEDELARKFALTTSTDAPPPHGCGADAGRGLRWFPDRTPWPVTWRYHTSGQDGVPGGGLTEFQRAVESWGDDPNTPVRYLYVGGTRLTNGFLRRDSVNAVIFGDPNDEIGGSFEDSGVLAIGGPWFLCTVASYAGEDFHPILEADIVVQDGAEDFFTFLRDPSSVAQELFAHELGHTLGLAHSLHREALMRADIHADGRGASFDVDDLAAAFHLYGRPEVPVDNDGPQAPLLLPPEAPSEPSAMVRDFTDVELSWTDESDSESNFLIERRAVGELNFRFVVTVPSGRTSYVDHVESESDYTYRVTAQNGAGRSRPSELIRVTTPVDPRPTAPSGLRVTGVSRSRVRVSWQDNSDDETSFAIELLRNNVWFDLPFTVPPNIAVAELLGLTSAVTFGFRVLARNAFGDSGYSNVFLAAPFPTHVSCRSARYQLCLRNGRFIVELYYIDPESGFELPATVDPVTDDSSLYWFFQDYNPELLVRAFDLPDGDTRIAFTGLTHVGYRLRVTDALTADVREHVQPAGGACDPSAEMSFTFPPTEGTGPIGPPSQEDLAGLVKHVRTLVPLVRQETEWMPAMTPVVPSDPHDPWRAESEAETAACVGNLALCTEGGRFAAELHWFDPDDPSTPRHAQAMTRRDSSGIFSFDEAGHADVVFKLLDGRPVNGRFWVFASATTDGASYELTVTDRATGTRRTYSHTAGADCGVVDTTAFADKPD